MPIISDPTAYTAPTFGDVVDEVIGNLQGYTLSPDMVTALTSDLALTDTVVPIAMPEGGCGVGVIEVGDEMMYVISVDTVNGTLNLLPKGRGWRSTVPAVHATGDTVTISPLVPRYRVKRAVNDVITQVWPGLYGVGFTEFQWIPGPTLAYEIPAEAEQILSVRFKDAYGNWVRIRNWEQINGENTDDFTSGTSLRITENPPFGTTVRVAYALRPAGLASETAPITDTGLSLTAKDAIVLGAMARLVPALDAGRLGVQYVPADELDQPRPVGSAIALAREFQKGFETAVAKERQALQNLYPARPHFVSAR